MSGRWRWPATGQAFCGRATWMNRSQEWYSWSLSRPIGNTAHPGSQGPPYHTRRKGSRGRMQFLILGPIEVRADGERVALGSGHQETVLAMLLTDPNRVVPLHRLVEAAWDGESPATARRQVQNTVSALRARLARAGSPGAIVTDGPGYRAVIGRGELDADVFESRVEAAHREAAADRAAAAVNDLRTALDM